MTRHVSSVFPTFTTDKIYWSVERIAHLYDFQDPVTGALDLKAVRTACEKAGIVTHKIGRSVRYLAEEVVEKLATRRGVSREIRT